MNPTSDPSELDSQLSALGHVGLVNHFRNGLKQDLVHEKLSSSAYRKLSFRLAAQVAARDARLLRHEKLIAASQLTNYVRSRKEDSMIDRLMATIEVYEEQGQSLWKTLSLWSNSSISSDPVRAPLIYHLTGTIVSTGERVQQPGPASLPSPPFSRSSSHQAVEKLSQQLPGEILALCQARIDALLRECQLSRDTLALLRETDLSLRKEVEEYEQKLELLQAEKGQSDRKLMDSQKQLQNVRDDLRRSQARIHGLQDEQQQSQDLISAHEDEIRRLEGCRNDMDRSLSDTELDISKLEQQFHSAQAKLDLLEKSKKDMEELVQSHETRGEKENAIHQSQLSAAYEQLSKIETDHKTSLDSLEHLRTVQTALEQEKNVLQEQIHAALTREDGYKAQTAKLNNELQDAMNACRTAGKELADEIAKFAGAEKSIIVLKEVVDRHEQAIEKLEASSTDLQRKLHGAKSIQNDFSESAAKLNLELEGEKARTVLLIEREAELKSQLSEYEEIVHRLNNRVSALEDALLTSKSEVGDSAKATTELERRLEEITSVLQEVRAAHEEKMNAIIASENGLRTMLTSVQEELQESRETVEQLRREKVARDVELLDLRNANDSLQQRLEAQRAHQEEMENKFMARLSATQARLSKSDETISQISKEKDHVERQAVHLKDCIEEVSDEKAKFEGEVLTLQEKLKMKETLSSTTKLTISSLREKLEAANTSRKDAHRKMTMANSQLSELKEQKEAVEADFANKVREHEAMITTMEEVSRKSSAVEEESARQVESVKEQLKEKQVMLVASKASLAALRSATHASDGEVQRLKTDIRDLKASVHQNEREKDDLRNEITRLYLKQDEDAEAVQQKDVQIAEIRKRYEEEAAELDWEVKTWKRQYDVKDTLVRTKSSRLETLEERLQSTGDEIAALEAQLQEKAEENDLLRNQTRASTPVLDALEHTLEQKQEEIARLRSDLDEKSTQAEVINREFRTLRRTNGKTVTRLSELEVQVEAKDKALGHFHQQFRILQKTTSESSKRLRQAEADLSARNTDINKLKHQNNEHLTAIASLRAELGHPQEAATGTRPPTSEPLTQSSDIPVPSVEHSSNSSLQLSGKSPQNSPTLSQGHESSFSQSHTRVNSSSSNMMNFFKDHLIPHRPRTPAAAVVTYGPKEGADSPPSATKSTGTVRRHGVLRRKFGQFGLGRRVVSGPAV
jgi:chromosome segregation ATPase